MARWGGKLATGFAFLAILAGCGHQNGCRVCDGPTREIMPLASRGEFLSSLQGTSLPPAALEGIGRLKPELPYRNLGVMDCQCIAVQSSKMANMLDLELAASAYQDSHHRCLLHRNDSAVQFKQTALSYVALEARNKSAAQALDSYYRLGEAEANWDIVQQSLAQLSEALAKARSLKAQGLDVPVDDTTLYCRQLDMQSQAVEVRLSLHQVNSELRTRLGIDMGCEPYWFWPADAFAVCAGPIDPAVACALGMQQRPELILLRYLEQQLNSENLAVVRQLLGTWNRLLGASNESPCCCLHRLTAHLGHATENAQLEIRRQQLHAYLMQREQEVSEEICQALGAVQALIEVVTLARQEVESRRAKVQELEEKEAKGIGSFAETLEARMEWQKARKKLVESIIKLQRACLLLRQAQGVLPQECGFGCTSALN
jgi:hypothetical protein